MARAVFLLFLIVAVITINAYPQGFSTQCGENEVFTRCGSTCPTTCTSVKFQPCTLKCFIGCECAEGYVRNAQNKCVLTQDC